MVRSLAVVAVVLTALACCAGPAAAALRPGSTIWRQQDFSGDSIRAIVATPNGGFVAAGMPRPISSTPYEAWVRGFRPDGSVDPSFGSGGTVTFAGDARWVIDAVVQPDGRILIAESYNGDYPPTTTTNLVRRLTSTGHRDPSFDMDGEVEPGLGPGTDTTLTSIALQPDGRVVLGGIRADGSLVAGRLLTDGSPDTSFGSGGLAVIAPGADTGPDLALQPDGGIVVVARRGNRLVAGRLTSAGAPDPSFGGGAGLTPVQFARPGWADRVSENRGVTPLVLPTGRIRLGVAFAPRGSHVDRSSLVGLTASGHPDRGFGNQGLAPGGPALRSADDPGPSNGGETPSRMVVDQRGGVLVVSIMSTSSDDLAAEGRTTVRRFRANGRLDRSFGTKGGVRFAGRYAAYTAVEDAAALVGDRLIVGEHNWDGKYQSNHNTRLLALDAGYDDDRPSISLTAGCRYLRVRIRDLSRLEAVVVRARGHVLRRTSVKLFRVRLPDGARRASVRATDLAGNTSRTRTRLPRC